MKYDFVYKHFKNIYEFEMFVNNSPTNKLFSEKGECSSQRFDEDGWAGTATYEEADGFLKNGWNTEVEKLDCELKKFSHTVLTMRKKPIKNVCGFAPIVPNAIRGVPKSMLSYRTQEREQKRRTIHIIVNNNAAGNTSSEVLMKCGLTVLKFSMLLNKQNARTRIDVIPILPVMNKSMYGCTVMLKDYKQPFNLSKLAYPLAHTSFFRRHGFRWLETMDGMKNRDMTKNYGYSLKKADEKIKEAYFKFAGFMEKDCVYIDVEDCKKAEYDPLNLAKLKQIAL